MFVCLLCKFKVCEQSHLFHYARIFLRKLWYKLEMFNQFVMGHQFSLFRRTRSNIVYCVTFNSFSLCFFWLIRVYALRLVEVENCMPSKWIWKTLHNAISNKILSNLCALCGQKYFVDATKQALYEYRPNESIKCHNLNSPNKISYFHFNIIRLMPQNNNTPKIRIWWMRRAANVPYSQRQLI